MGTRLTGDTLAEVTALQREFPAWVVWPCGDGRWSAPRAPGDRQPSPGSWLLWVYADDPAELTDRMRETDQ